MKQESNFGYILRLTLTLLLICAVMAAALAGVNAITKDKIAAVKEQKTLAAMEKVLPGVTGLEQIELTGDPGIVRTVYASGSSYAVEVAPTGFGGEVTLMVGIADGKVTGISVISHAETPGLGAVAAADTDKGVSFREQFEGLVAGITIGDGENQIDALSGATITSTAIVDGVNAALEYIKSLG